MSPAGRRALRRTISELEPIWAAVDRALWVERHRPSFRVFVWRGADRVHVYAEQDGALLDEWLLQETVGGQPPTIATAQATIRERVEMGY